MLFSTFYSSQLILDNGAAVATGISEFTALALQFYWGRRHLPQHLFPARLWNLGVAGVIMSLLIWIITLIAMSLWLHLLIGTIVGITSYFTLLLWLKNEFALSLFYDS